MIYALDADEKTLEQYNSAIDLPCVTRSALMADAHAGYSLPIGAVVETDGIIFPSWVGYDIGCGVLGYQTPLSIYDIEDRLEEIYTGILAAVPVGFNKHTEPQDDQDISLGLSPEAYSIYHDRGGQYQLGTLGGGNHFIEVGYDASDNVWVTIHSGSRGAGHGIASHYMALAADSDEPLEGHFGFGVHTDLGKSYLRDQNIMVKYALMNRMDMLRHTCGVLGCPCPPLHHVINQPHNFVEVDEDGLCLHRKGATIAHQGVMGVIPGNMRDGTAVVVGKGDPQSLHSASHGAGRVLSRSKARKTIDLKVFAQQMEGIVCDPAESRLDEAPGAYKNFQEVMDAQRDLVQVTHWVHPLVNVKG